MTNHPNRSRKSAYIYRIVCTDDAGWSGDRLWSSQYAAPASRIFGSRREAVAVRRDMDSCDYAATIADYDGDPCQPTFAVIRVPAIEAAYVAWLDSDMDAFDRVLSVSGLPSPAGYVPGETEDLDRETVLAWISSLPAAVRRAVLPPSPIDERAAEFRRTGASLAGASSLTHTYALMSALVAAEAEEVRRAAARASGSP